MNTSIPFFKRIRTRISGLLVLIALISIGFTGALSILSARKSLMKNDLDHLHALGSLKGNEIKSFLDRKLQDLIILSGSQNTIDAYRMLKEYHDEGFATATGKFDVSTERYQDIYTQMDPYFQSFIKTYHFYDLFFICADHGHVMYTAEKEKDLGTNLSSGEYKGTGLGRLWEKVTTEKTPLIVDFMYYPPSGEPAAFLGAPVFDESGTMIAILAMQISTTRINEIMNDKTGLGETGETYLVGEDYLMRSDSRFESESTINTKSVKTKSTTNALKGNAGSHIIEDYRGKKVLSYYAPLNLGEDLPVDFDWVMIAEIDKAEAFRDIRALLLRIVLIGIILLSAGIIIALLFSKMITKPIVQLTTAASTLAKGNLAEKIDVKADGEIGKLAHSFSMMRDTIKAQLEEIMEGVNVLSSSSSEIMAMISQLASSSSETATSINETTTTIEEVKQTVEVSNQRANEVVDSGKKLSMVSMQGKKSVEDTIEGMNKIKQQMEKIADIVIQLSDKSATIGEIASNVNDLAEQSNLLAVNASIEAAKAGDHGRGFSVVAQEIKNLAQRSKESTVQIRNILGDIQKEISSAVLATENGSKAIDSGMELTSSAKEVISTLAASVEQSSQANIQIAASNQQQLVGMDQITTAMENIREASTQATEGTKQAEESVGELKKLGEKLLAVLDNYRLK